MSDDRKRLLIRTKEVADMASERAQLVLHQTNGRGLRVEHRPEIEDIRWGLSTSKKKFAWKKYSLA